MNIHTLHVEHVMLLAVYTLLTLANSLLYRTMKGIHWFSLYNVFALVGACGVTLRGRIPDFLSIVGGNLFVIVAYSLLFLSVAALFESKRSHLYLQAALILTGVVTMVQYGSVHPNTTLRLIFYSAVLGCQQLHIAAFIVLRQGGKLRKVGSAMALMLAALAAFNLVRILGLVLHGAPSDYLQAGPFLAWIVVANTCLQCGAMVSYVWMAAAMLRRDLELQATTDPLTGLLNRRALEQAAEREIAASRQRRIPLAVITIDLDNFKRINDSHGHTAGDTTLIAVATCLQQAMRSTDLLARTGGDEFTILLPRTPLQAATEIAGRLRHSMEDLDILCGQVRTGITASFGLAALDHVQTDWHVLLNRSDKALYEAKRAGGNIAIANPDNIPAILDQMIA